MNLLGITAGAVAAINPQIPCVLPMSTGYAIGPDGTQTPQYTPFPNILVQVQALSYTDLMKTGGLNIQGTRRKAYLMGGWEGVDRPGVKGGDLLSMPNLPDFPGPTTWLIVQVLEWWQDWCSVAITLQNGS